MMVYFDNVGAIGVIRDLPYYDLPQDAWSDAQNIRFQDGRIEKMAGESEVFEGSVSVMGSPYWLLPVQTDTSFFWLYPGSATAWATDGDAHAALNSAGVAFSMSDNVGWNGGVIGGLAVINNGVDEPQVWTPSLSNTLKPLQYDGSAGTTWATASAGPLAQVIRPFKQFLVALDITENAVRNPRKIWWSHPAEPGTEPYTWDYNKTEYDAGQLELAETTDLLVDCLPLRDDNIIYKTGSTWRMSYIGGNQIFRLRREFDFGAISDRCIKGVYNQHFVFGTDDVILHDMQSVNQVLKKKMRTWLFANIDPTNYVRSFVAANYPKSEMWICFPETGNDWCNKALIWNWRDNTTTIRELSGISHIGYGLVDPSLESTSFDGDTGISFDADTGTFNEQAYNPTLSKMLQAYPHATSPKLLLTDSDNTFNGTNMTSYVQRSGLPLGRQGSDGKIHVDLSKIKFVKAIYPQIKAANGTVISIYIGTQMEIGDTISWSPAYSFTMGTDRKVDVRATARIISIKFETAGDVWWEMDTFGVEFDYRGKR